jgi:hypothetical protein
MSIVYLVKDNNALISHCYCRTARISLPRQLSCPWCGCGWLFSCMECRQAFTFARGEEIDATWTELARLDLGLYQRSEPTVEEIEENTTLLLKLHQGIEVGRRYVYFDGMVVDASAGGIHGEGQHAWHDLDYVPQVAAQSDRTRMKWILENVQYWEENDLPRRRRRSTW